MCDRDDKGPWGEFARAAEEFGKSMEGMFRGFGCCAQETTGDTGPFRFHADFAPARPRMNRFTDKEGNLVFEFLLPGFDMADIDLGFSGDVMYLSAKRPPDGEGSESVKGDPAGDFRGFRIRDVERREYPVRSSEWKQAEAKAVLRRGILRVSVPPLPAGGEEGGVKVQIVSD